MLKKILIIAPFLMLTLTACESVVGTGHPRGIAMYEGNPRLGEVVERVCFTERLDRFRQTERQSVILRDETRQEYLVEVGRTCPELKNAGYVDIKINEAGDYCLAPGENLVVSLTSAVERSRLGADICEILEVRKWKSQAEVKAASKAE